MSIQALREKHAELVNNVRNLMDNTGAKDWNDEHQSQYDNQMAEIESVRGQIKNHEKMLEIESEANATEQVADVAARYGHDNKDPAASIYAKWLRAGDSALTAEDWTTVRNAMSTGVDTEGGYTVQTEVATRILDAMAKFGGMRQAASVMRTAAGNTMEWPTSDGTAETGEQIGENVSATDQDIAFGMIPLATYKYSSKVVPVPIELLQDSAVDLETFINSRLTKRIGRITNTKFTTGTGTGEPKGIVTAAEAGKVGATGQTTTVTFEDLIDLIHSIDPAYRETGDCGFMLNDDTMRLIRQIKDSNGRPIFIPGNDGLGNPMPDSILGYNVETNQDIATMSASGKSILFGKLNDYLIRDVVGASMFRFTDSAYAKKGQVGFLMMSRHGGTFTDVGGSVKYYQNSAT